MHQLKLFTGVEGESQSLERDINDWLRTSGAKVVQVFGNIAPQAVIHYPDTRPLPGADPGSSRRFGPSDILVAILYDDGGQAPMGR
jgi:hypothetical protein